MADPTIDVAFVEEFEAEVHLAYQRQGSKLRGTVRTRNNVKNKTTFQKVAKGNATQKARQGKVPPMNLAHTNVPVTVEDWFAGEWVDDLDVLRINHDEFMVAASSGAFALGRKTDEQIRDAMETTTNQVDASAAGVTLAKALELMEAFGNNDVPEDDGRFAVVGYETWGDLLQLSEFANSDFVGSDDLPFVNMTAKRWMSFMWFPHSGLASDGSNRKGFGYHRSAVGHAIGNDVESNMQYHNDHDSWFILNKMQMNAVAIDVSGIYRILAKL